MLELESESPSEAPLVYLLEGDGAFRLCLDLKRLLESDGYQVVSFSSVQNLLLQLPGSTPACLVFGVETLGPEGLDLQDLLASKSDLPVILLTSNTTARDVVRAMKQGAADLFCNPFDERALLSAVDKAVVDYTVKRESRKLQAEFQLRFASLTPREQEVYELLVRGASSEKVCERLGLAERTLKHHRLRILEKLGVRSIVHLVLLAEGRRAATPA